MDDSSGQIFLSKKKSRRCHLSPQNIYNPAPAQKWQANESAKKWRTMRNTKWKYKHPILSENLSELFYIYIYIYIYVLPKKTNDKFSGMFASPSSRTPSHVSLSADSVGTSASVFGDSPWRTRCGLLWNLMSSNNLMALIELSDKIFSTHNLLLWNVNNP